MFLQSTDEDVSLRQHKRKDDLNAVFDPRMGEDSRVLDWELSPLSEYVLRPLQITYKANKSTIPGHLRFNMALKMFLYARPQVEILNMLCDAASIGYEPAQAVVKAAFDFCGESI